jgi:serine/threonine protein kinase
MLTPQIMLQGRYTIIRAIGQGGVGAVYEARDERLKSRVAIKHLQLTDAAAIKDFEREAHLLANLKHASLPKVSDHFTEQANHFLVMEYITGDDLAGQLAVRGQPFDVREVLSWADQLLAALAYLHRQTPPILHRDIKPANLKVTDDGTLMLLDFGLAKGSLAATLHTTNSVRGYTPQYAPLEQIQGTGTTEQSDLYAVGATLFQLLTNSFPPDALTRVSATINRKPDPLPDPQQLNAAIPAHVRDALIQAMSIDMVSRPLSALAMRQGLQGSVRTVIGGDTPTIRSTGGPAPRLIRPGRWMIIGGIVTLVALAGGLAANELGIGVAEHGTPTSAVVGDQANPAPITPLAPGATATSPVTSIVAPIATATVTSLPSATPTLRASSTPTDVPPTPTADAVIAIASLNMRSGPDTVYSLVGSYPQGTALTVLGKNNDGSWLKVQAVDGGSGWMFAANLQINRDLRTLEVAQAPPRPTALPQPTNTRVVPPAQPLPATPTQLAGDFLVDGTWFGTTSSGGTMSFLVENRVVVSITVNPQGTCDNTYNLNVYEGGSKKGYIQNNRFSIPGTLPIDLFTMAGVFSSNTRASGSMAISEIHGCGANFDFTWNASR